MSLIIINSNYIWFVTIPLLVTLIIGFVIHYLSLRKKKAYLEALVNNLIKNKK